MNSKSFLLALILLLFLFAPSARAVEVSIVYWGDRFARDFPQQAIGDSLEAGGAAQLAGLIDALKSSNPATFVFSAGGDLAGTPAATNTQGLAPAKVLARIGPDAFAPGIVDFSLGVSALKKVVAKTKLPALLSNGYLEGSGLLFQSGLTIQRSGVSVAVTGVASGRLLEAVPRNEIKGLTFSDPVQAVKDFSELRRKDANLVIVLSQLGWEADSSLATTVPGLNIIIEGHSSESFDPPRLVGKTLILASPPEGRSLGRLLLDVDTTNHTFSLKMNEFQPVVKGVIPPNTDVKRLVVELEQRYVRDRGEKLASLMVDWNLNPNAPCNLAQWAATQLTGFSAASRLSVVANHNFGKGLQRGDVNERDLEEIFPFDTPILAFQINGQELRKVIEKQAAGKLPFLTWGGLGVALEGDTVAQIAVGGAQLKDEDEFAVITDGIFWDRFTENTGLNPDIRPTFFFPGSEREFLKEALKKQKVISAPLDDRWLVR